MKLSDELKRCLDGSGCGNCEHREAETKFICRGLLGKAYEWIKGYEELEEQGLLLKLPCKIGDTVYRIEYRYTKCSIHREEFDEYNCQGCEECECDSHKEYYISETKPSISWVIDHMDWIDKTVFLTKSEAESALQKMNEMEWKND